MDGRGPWPAHHHSSARLKTKLGTRNRFVPPFIPPKDVEFETWFRDAAAAFQEDGSTPQFRPPPWPAGQPQRPDEALRLWFYKAVAHFLRDGTMPPNRPPPRKR